MDKARENVKLKNKLNNKTWKIYPTIEWTAKNRLQQNHLVEVGFATLYGRGRSMMIEANVPKDLRHVAAQKAFETATKLDGLVPTLIKRVVKPRIEHVAGKILPYVDYLRKWGEAGIVKTKSKQTAKMADRGIKCMMVGYANDHSGNTYKMLN